MDVLVTGSSRGIGRAIAVELAREGGRVVINYLMNEDAAAETADLVRAVGGEPIVIQADVRSEKDCKRLAASLDRYDVLVHNAAIGALKPTEKIRTPQWDLTMESSLRPFWLLTRLCLDFMAPGGSIIGITSTGSRKFVPGYSAMGAAKAGVEALTRQLAVELSPRKIRVNTVCGGLIDTDALRYFPERERMVKFATQYTPLGRMGQPQDMADAVRLLVSPQAGFITGQVLVVDGGLSLL
jgi:enoyl-[acyl-carrier protein] reductase III